VHGTPFFILTINEVFMEHLFRISLFAGVIFSLVITKTVNTPQVAIMLLLICMNIAIWKFGRGKLLLVICAAGLSTIYFGYPLLLPLFSILLYDAVIAASTPLILFAGVAPIFFLIDHGLGFPDPSGSYRILLMMLLVTAGSLGISKRKQNARELLYKESFDAERRSRYELEKTQLQLKESTREISRLTEIRERTRISRELHDSLGHSLAGLLLQLQAARKIHPVDSEKALALVDQTIQGLSDALVLVRETVHNIKPAIDVDFHYFEQIISNFRFSNIQFKHSGNPAHLSMEIMECLGTNLKEALTNAAKYSGAENVHIEITANENFARMLVKDDGKGSAKLKEGLGLSGMRERLKNLGGSFSYDGSAGFTLVCYIPLGKQGLHSGRMTSEDGPSSERR